jgi:hypothetical protein
VRPVGSGAPRDSDIYGAQQHAPLLGITVTLDDATLDDVTLNAPPPAAR